jgi:hypothetical protein
MSVDMGAETPVSAMGNVRLKRKRVPLYPLPADFAANALTESVASLERRYDVTANVIRRWFSESGAVRVFGRGLKAPVPADFAEMAAKLTKLGLQRHYHKNWDCISRWVAESGVEPQKQPICGNAVGKPVPDDFSEVAPKLTIAELERRYKAQGVTVHRWCNLAGVTPRKFTHVSGRSSAPKAAAVPAVNLSDAAQAAQFLRRQVIVYPCDILTREERAKLPDFGKDLWYINGRGAVPAADMIALAERKGFDRRAWARI